MHAKDSSVPAFSVTLPNQPFADLLRKRGEGVRRSLEVTSGLLTTPDPGGDDVSLTELLRHYLRTAADSSYVHLQMSQSLQRRTVEEEGEGFNHRMSIAVNQRPVPSLSFSNPASLERAQSTLASPCKSYPAQVKSKLSREGVSREGRFSQRSFECSRKQIPHGVHVRPRAAIWQKRLRSDRPRWQ